MIEQISVRKAIKAPKTYYVYTYAYPDTGIVFYVGKGTQGRIDEHEREARIGCECQKCQVIRQIWDTSNPVQKRIVFESLVESEALDQERRLIEQNSSIILVNKLMNKHAVKEPKREEPKQVANKEQSLEKRVNGIDYLSVGGAMEELKLSKSKLYTYINVLGMQIHKLTSGSYITKDDVATIRELVEQNKDN